MNRSQRYGNKNVSVAAGIIVMAFVAVALGYLLGNWVIQFVAGSNVNQVSSDPIIRETTISDPSRTQTITPITTPGTTTQPNVQIIPDPQQSGLYVVQLGSFNSYANAERLRDELLEKGYPSTVITEGPPYKVQLRASRTREEANRLRDEMRRDGYVDVFVVH